MSPRAGTVRFMTPGRWIVIAVMTIVLILLSLNLYYQWIHNGIWREEREAVETARTAGGLAEVTRADKFVWDETVWVVEGEDAAGTELFVWIAGDDVTRVPAAEAYSAEQLKADVLRAFPDADIIRIRPGLTEGERIWEVYYRRPENVMRYYYGFYDFETGRLITTYKLPSRTAN